VEIGLAALTLFMFTEAFVPRLFAPASALAEGDDKLLRYLWLPFYALAGAGIIVAGRTSWATLRRSPWLVLLSLMAVLSTFWSIETEITARRSTAVMATTLLGVYLAARFDWLTALRLLACVWLAVLAATLVVGLLAPGFARMTDVHVGAWSGAWWEKNQLGGHAARQAFLFAFLAWRDVAWRGAWIVALAVAVTLVVLSTSATALLGLAIGFAVLGAAACMRRGRRTALVFAWGSAAGLVVLALSYVVAPKVLLGLVGREPTLTGRTDIWSELTQAITERPWLGYGYQAFWSVESEPRYWLQKAVEWAAPSGHNGWLDLAVSLGLVGVALFGIDLLLTSARAIKTSLRSPIGVFAIGAIAQYLLFAMSESLFLVQNNIIWATYALISAKLALDAAPRRAPDHSSSSERAIPQSAAAAVGAARMAP